MVRAVCGGSLVEARIASPRSILPLRGSLPFMPVRSLFPRSGSAPDQMKKTDALLFHPNKCPRNNASRVLVGRIRPRGSPPLVCCCYIIFNSRSKTSSIDSGMPPRRGLPSRSSRSSRSRAASTSRLDVRFENRNILVATINNRWNLGD